MTWRAFRRCSLPFFLGILLVPLFAAILAVCYYELRSHREGVTVEEIGRQTRALLDRKDSRAKTVVHLGFVAVLIASFLCLTIVPVSSLPASLPFYLGVWKVELVNVESLMKREVLEERRFVAEIIRNDDELSNGHVGSWKKTQGNQPHFGAEVDAHPRA